MWASDGWDWDWDWDGNWDWDGIGIMIEMRGNEVGWGGGNGTDDVEGC